MPARNALKRTEKTSRVELEPHFRRLIAGWSDLSFGSRLYIFVAKQLHPNGIKVVWGNLFPAVVY